MDFIWIRIVHVSRTIPNGGGQRLHSDIWLKLSQRKTGEEKKNKCELNAKTRVIAFGCNREQRKLENLFSGRYITVGRDSVSVALEYTRLMSAPSAFGPVNNSILLRRLWQIIAYSLFRFPFSLAAKSHVRCLAAKGTHSSSEWKRISLANDDERSQTDGRMVRAPCNCIDWTLANSFTHLLCSCCPVPDAAHLT